MPIRATRLSMLLAACLAYLPVRAAEIELKAHAVAPQRVIRLGDLALIAAPAARAAELAALELGASPRPGQSARYSRARLARELRLRGAGDVRWRGAETVTVETAVTVHPAADLADTARSHVERILAEAGMRPAVTVLEGQEPLRLPAGSVTLRVRPLTAAQALKARLTVWLDVLLDGVHYGSHAVRLGVRARRPALFARRGLARGQALGCEDLETREADADPRMPAESQCEQIAGRLRVRHPVAAGAPLLAADVRPQPAIAQGDTVRLEVDAGAIVLEASAEALSDGAVGQNVLVRAGQGADAVSALVAGPGLVRITRR